MALKLKEIDMECGIKILNPYFRVRFASYDNLEKKVRFNGDFFVSEEARRSGQVQSLPGVFLDGAIACELSKEENLFAQSYNLIKAQAQDFKDRGITLENIVAMNDSLYKENGVDCEFINPLYLYFIDAEDIFESPKES